MKYINGESAHIKNTFAVEDLDRFFNLLHSDIKWEKKEWKAGRFLPRLVFSYAKGDRKVDILDELIDFCEASFECNVFSVWCNLYKNGSDYTPFHQDNYDAHVITYSFGASRKFVCQNIETKLNTEYLLENGDVFYFSPNFDKKHQHSIPKTKNAEPRISIVLFTDKPYQSRDKLSKIPGTGDEYFIVATPDGEILVSYEELLEILD